MKKIKHIIFYFLFAFIGISIHPMQDATASAKTVAQSNDEELMQSLQQLCTNQIILMERSLLSALDKLFCYKQYWLKQQIRPTYTLLPNTVHTWFYGKTVDSIIEQALAQLNILIKKNAAALGELHLKRIALSQAEKDARYGYLQDITIFITTLLPNKLPDTATADISPILLRTLILDNINNIKMYDSTLTESLSNYAKPSHVTRNWGKYAILTVCAVAGIYTYTKNKQIIDQYVKQAPKAIENFYYTYISNPIKNSWNTIFQNEEEESLIPDAMIKNDESMLKLTELQYLQDNNKQNMSNDEIKNVIADATEKNDLSFMEDEFNEQIKYPRYNLLHWNGKIARQFIIYFLNKIVALERTGKKLEEKFIKANRLNFELLMTMPAVLGLYGLYKIGNHYHSKLVHKFRYKPMNIALHNIQIILTNTTAEINTPDHGLIFYWTDKLSLLSKYLSLNQQIFFKQDIEQLASPRYSLTQKKEVINRMYQTSDFLREPLKN